MDTEARLSEHFTLEELTKSSTADRLGIDNTSPPDGEVMGNLRFLAASILEPVREHFGKPFLCSSGYRCFALERSLCRDAIQRFLERGDGQTDLDYLKLKSHPTGEAADFEIPGVSNLELAHWIENNLDFDQVILEFYKPGIPNSGWVHASTRRYGSNRNEVLTITKGGRVSGLPLL